MYLYFFLQAFAELLHEKVRKTVWGYADTEALSAADLHKIKYEVSYTNSRSADINFIHVVGTGIIYMYLCVFLQKVVLPLSPTPVS